MKLYLFKCQRAPFEQTNGFVIAANSESEARSVAANHAHDEGPEVWSDERVYPCTYIGDAIGINMPQVLLESVNYG